MMRIQSLIFFFFFFLTIVYGQDHKEEFDEIEKQEAERLVRIFNTRFKALIIEKLVSIPDAESFSIFSTTYIARDRRLFFNKALHKALLEKDIDNYIENTLFRIYKNIQVDFIKNKQSANIPTIESQRIEANGDPCNNVDFESGNTNGWDGWTGFASTNAYPMSNTLTPGFAGSQHSIQTGLGYDAIVGGNLLPVVAPGGNFSLRLENLATGGNLSRISQTFLVNPANVNFTYRYAVVLEDPSNSHIDLERPYFKIKVIDGSGNEILCGKYEVIAKPPITAFQQVGGTGYYWRDWTSVSISLAAFVGQNITIEFTASDCALGGHLGYAYIDGSCFQSRIESTPTGLCNGFPYTLKAPPGYASYSWTGPGIISSNTLQSISVNQPGTYVCSIESVSGSSCLTYLKATVGNSASVSAGPDFHICKGGYAQLNGNLTLVKSFNWSPTDGMTIANVLNPIVRLDTTTTYYLNACGMTDTVTVFVDKVDFDISPSILLCNPSLLSLNATPSLPGNYTYSWSPNVGMTGANTSNPIVNISFSTIFTALVTNLNTGCSNSKTETVTISSSVKTEAGSVDTICVSSSIQLIANGGTSFNWTDINGNPPLGLSCSNCSNPVSSPIVTSSYIVTSNLAAPCINKDTVTIVVKKPPAITLGNDTLLCKGTSALYDVTTSGCSYLWSTGATTPTLLILKKGSYWVSVDNGTCVKKDTVKIQFTSPPKPWSDTTICLGSEILYTLKNDYQSYLWQDSSVNSTFIATATSFNKQLIKVELMDSYNCKYLDSAYLSAKDCSPLFIPNLITPNGDSKNDKFHIKGLPAESVLYIYNRWGDLIYKNSDYDNSWQGNTSDGIYYFNLKLMDGREFKGWLEVLN